MEERCDVCGKPLDEDNVSRCFLCGRRFHMAWSVQAQVENCRRIWINQMHCSIGFVCNVCVVENPQLAPSLLDMEQGPPF